MCSPLRNWSFVCLFLAALSASAANAESKRQATDRRQPAPTPILVCPPRFSTPLFVPADELPLPPETPEGWIIRNRPVQECIHYFGDAEQRSHELFEKPMQLMRYNSQIRLLEAEVVSLQRRLANYRYFNKAGGLFITVENAQLAVVATQEQLRNLRYERMLYVRMQNLERELNQGVPVE